MCHPRLATRSSIAIAGLDNNCVLFEQNMLFLNKLNPEFSRYA